MFTNKLKNMFFFNTDAATATKDFSVLSEEEINKLLEESEAKDYENPIDNAIDTFTKSDDKEETKKQPESADKKTGEPTDKKDDKPSGTNDTLGDTKPIDSKEDTLSVKDYTIVSKDLIKSFSEDEQKTLARYEGKPISELMKAVVEKQREIGRLSNRKNISEKPETVYPNPSESPEKAAEANKVKEQLIDKNMQNLFPDYPKDEYEWSELQTSNYVKAYKYAAEREKMAQAIDTQYNAAVLIQNNYHAINDEVIKESASKMSDMLKNFGLDLEKDFGIKTNDENSVNEFLDSMLVGKDGRLDLSVFDTWEKNGKPALKYGVPIINPNGLINKFSTQYLPHIVLKIKENAFIEGLTAAQSKNLPPSFSNTNTVLRKNPSKNLIPQTIEELDRAIAESEEKSNY